jgi:ligand-binding sensor domain-containing protein
LKTISTFTTAAQVNAVGIIQPLVRSWAGWIGGLILLLLAFPRVGQAQHYTITKLPLFSGRSDWMIKDVTRDSLGFIWFLANNEIYRYDGYRSLPILPTIKGRHILDNHPQKMLMDQSNRLWIASDYGLSCLDLKTWKLTYVDRTLLPKGKGSTIAWIRQVSDGMLILAYQNGSLLLIKDGKARLISTLFKLGNQQNNLIVPQHCTFWRGRYWISTSAGTLFSMDANDPTKNQYHQLPGIHQAIFHLVAMDDRLVIDVFKQGLFSVNSAMQISEQKIQGTKAIIEELRVFQEGDQQNVYATSNHIFILDKNLKVVQKLDAALPQRNILICNDEIILGTDDGIYVLYKTTRGLDKLLPCNGDAESKSVRGIHVFSDGAIFWASYGGAGYVTKEGRCIPLNDLKIAFCTLPVGEDELLVGMEGSFLKIFDRKTMKIRDFHLSLSDLAKKKFSNNLPTVVLSLAQTPKEYVIGSSKGLWMVDKSRHTLRPIEISVDGHPVHGLQIRNIQTLEHDGAWLLSTQIGLLRVDANGIGDILYPAQGTSGVYKAMTVKDTIWLATQEKGLVALNREGKFMKNWTRLDGLSSDVVYSLEFIKGMKIIGTADGLNIVQNGMVRRLSENEGLSHAEYNFGASFWDAPRQRLFMGSLHGYTVLDMTQDWMHVTEAESYINEVHLSSAEHSAIEKDYTWPYAGKKSLDLMPGQSLMGLYIGTPGNYRTPVSVNYLLKSGPWQALAPGQFISLVEPSPGRYPIMLQTISTGSLGKILSLVITKLPAYYESWWFRVLIFFGGIFLVVAWYRSKIRKVRREQELRNRIAADLHDEVGGLLTGISMKTELLRMTKDPQRRYFYFDQLSALSKEAIHSMSDVVWSLDSQYDTWESVLGKIRNFSVQLFDTSPVQFFMDVKGTPPDTLHQKERQAVYLIIREAITNACKHARASVIHLKITFSTRQINVEVSDNGIGFEERTTVTGNGLKNMKKRAATIGGRLEVQSSASGTRVELRYITDTFVPGL